MGFPQATIATPLTLSHAQFFFFFLIREELFQRWFANLFCGEEYIATPVGAEQITRASHVMHPEKNVLELKIQNKHVILAREPVVHA